MKTRTNYMLYDNWDSKSIAYGDIEYITEHLCDYIANGKPEHTLRIEATEANVIKVLKEYNYSHKFSLVLFKHLTGNR